MSRIVVTGLGIVSPLGFDGQTVWNSLACGVAPSPGVSGVPGFERLEKSGGYYLSHEQREACGTRPDAARASDLAIAASRLAVADAGLECRDTELVIGAVFGSGMGDAQYWRTVRAGERKNQDFIFRTADRVGEALELDGPVLEVSTACAAGGYAIAAASMLLRSGEADVIVCGGADAPSFHALAAFNRLGALDEAGCRPFDVRRAGTLFGEGAAVLVLEREDVFVARGGKQVYARLEGFGISCDAAHPTAPAEDGAQIERAMRMAFSRSGVGEMSIGVILPHATGTQLNDVVESGVITRVFGPRANQPWSLPLKAYAGHGGGMSGALAALVAVLILSRDEIPPAPPYEATPECDVRLPDRLIHDASIGHALVSAYAFGGANVSLVFGNSGGAS